jgi:hypothetical protein
MSKTRTRITQVGPVSVQDRIQLRHPDPKKKMPRLPKDSYAVVHKTALAVVPKKAPGITLNAYLDEMKKRLPKVRGWDRSASASWYAMAIKLDMEARGELKRVKDKPPQRLIRA